MTSTPSIKIDVLTATASSLQSLLESRSIRSTDLIEAYLAQIERHNREGLKLHAVISMTLKDLLLQTAQKLDDERAAEIVRGPLHRIPALIKDSICTGPEFGLPTTLGTISFQHAIAKGDAPIIDRLIDAGAIILSKTNLSTLGGIKGSTCLTGWSENEGQTQSAYIKGGAVPGDTFLGHSLPGSSSSGSAVSFSAGFAPLSLGTESDGSIMAPADRASIYAVKITPGKLDISGTLPQSGFSDCVGPMARSSRDIADMLTVMLGDNIDFTTYLTTSWTNLSMGFLDPEEWKSSAATSKPLEGYIEQVSSEISAAAEKIAQQGGSIKKWVRLRRFGGDGDEEALEKTVWYSYPAGFTHFTSTNFSNPPARTLPELTSFNTAHPTECLPPEAPLQDEIQDAANHSQDVSEAAYKQAVQILKSNNLHNGIQALMQSKDINIIIGAPTGRFPTIAAAARCPCAALPLGYSRQNGRAFGVMAVVGPGREDLLVRVMSAWEGMFGAQRVPPQLLGWE